MMNTVCSSVLLGQTVSLHHYTQAHEIVVQGGSLMALCLVAGIVLDKGQVGEPNEGDHCGVKD